MAQFYEHDLTCICYSIENINKLLCSIKLLLLCFEPIFTTSVFIENIYNEAPVLVKIFVRF